MCVRTIWNKWPHNLHRIANCLSCGYTGITPYQEWVVERCLGVSVAVLVQLLELPGGRCMSVLPMLLGWGELCSLLWFCSFFVILAMDCAAAALVSHRLSKQAQNKTDGILPYWFRCWVQSFEQQHSESACCLGSLWGVLEAPEWSSADSGLQLHF